MVYHVISSFLLLCIHVPVLTYLLYVCTHSPMKSPLLVRGWKMGAEAGLNLSGGGPHSPPLSAPFSSLPFTLHPSPFRSLALSIRLLIISCAPSHGTRSSFGVAPPRIIIQSHVFLLQPSGDLLTLVSDLVTHGSEPNHGVLGSPPLRRSS